MTSSYRRSAAAACALAALLAFAARIYANGDAGAADPAQPETHQHATASPDGEPGWTFHLDGTLFATFDRQGGRRGDTELTSQNWLMAMATRTLGPGILSVKGMFSAEPVTAHGVGYSEIFQEGEAYNGLQITDHQHPHDLFMQLAAGWQLPIGGGASVTISGAPVGEATLGPVAFMHRPSASENPTAPLAHHIFDSTHIASSVVLARVDRGWLAVEASVFHGREPDQNRYDLDFGAIDSWAARAWIHSGPWTIQASHGYLHEPEQLEPGSQRRTNASLSWLQERGSDYTAFTVALGRTVRPYSDLGALLVEGTEHVGRTSLYGRVERRSVETEILLFPEMVHRPHPGELVDPIAAFTAGAVEDIAQLGPLVMGIGADATLYSVPPLLQFNYGNHPASFHVFLRIARANPAARMWNMTMGASAAEHAHEHR